MCRYCCVILGYGLIVASAGLAAEIPSAELQLAKFVLSGMKSSREMLQRGEFTAVGSTIEGEAGPGQIKGDIRYHFAFDFAKRSFRYESTVPELIYSPPTAEEKAQAEASGGPLITTRHPSLAIGLQPYSRAVIDTLEADVGWDSHLSNGMTIYPPTELQGKFEGYFDVRTLGLNMPSGRGMGVSYDDLLAAYDKHTLVEARDLSKSLVRISWVGGPKNGARIAISFDKDQGYSPVHLELCEKLGNGNWGTPYYFNDLKWTILSDVWVPVSYSFDVRQNPSYANTFHLDFTWDSVNQPLPEKKFTWQWLKQSEDAFVVDMRLGQERQVMLARPKSLQEVIDQHSRPEVRTVPRSIWQSYWLWGCVGFVLIGSVAWFVHWQRA